LDGSQSSVTVETSIIGHITIIDHNTTTKASSWQVLNQKAVDKELGAILELMQGEQEEESGVMAKALAMATVEEPQQQAPAPPLQPAYVTEQHVMAEGL
jgi:hypothetical protein